MATYIDDTGFPRGPKHPTLENVAEEMLNGMLCHYEAPAEVYRKGGILKHKKNRKKDKKKHATADKSIRWVDSKGQPPVEDDNIGYFGGILDASVQAGCISATRKEHIVDFFVPPRHKSRAHSNVIFDDEGNAVTLDADDRMIETPPTPPPSKREIFVPQLCGVRINCADDEEHLAELAEVDAHFRATQYRDLMMEEDDDGTNSLLENGSSKSGSKRSNDLKAFRDGLQKQQDDWEGSDVVDERFTSPCAAKDAIEQMREDTDGRIVSSAPAARLGRRKSVDARDWDESLPIAPNAAPTDQQRKSRWSILGRSKREPSPGRNKTRGRSKSPGRKESKLPSRNILAGKENKDDLPHPGLHPAHPLNQYPYLRAHLQGDKTPEEAVVEDDEKYEKQSMISAHRRNFDGPTEQHAALTDDQLERQSFITDYRRGFGDMAPAPPPRRPDVEKQSFITDHRSMIDTNKAVAAASGAPPVSFNNGADLARFKSCQMADPSAEKTETRSMVMTPAGMQLTPPRPPRTAKGNTPYMPRIQESFSNGSLDPPRATSDLFRSNEPELAKKPEDEATWEQRTQEAWNRLRSGLGFGLDEAEKTEASPKPEEAKEDEQSQTASSLGSRSGSSSQKRPIGILKASSYDRRVSFGPTEERTFVDDSDENVPAHMSAPVQVPSHLSLEESIKTQPVAPVPRHSAPPPYSSQSYSYSSQGTNSSSRKTKRVFRGTKLIKNMMGRGGHSRRNSYASSEQMTGAGTGEVRVLRTVNRPRHDPM